MRRFMCLVLLILFVGSSAFTESIDIASLSDEELLALQERVNQEVDLRFGEELTSWYDYGFGQYLPDYEKVVGHSIELSKLSYNHDDSFAAQFKGATDDDFAKYCDALSAWGYNIDKQTSGREYEASDNEGHNVNMTYIGDMITIKLD